jgi:hypothetical protein
MLKSAAKDGDVNMGGAQHVRNHNTKVPQLTLCGGQGDGQGT